MACMLNAQNLLMANRLSDRRTRTVLKFRWPYAADLIYALADGFHN